MLISEPEHLSRNAAACDGPACGTWSREPESHGFLELVWSDSRYLFCNADCALRFLAEHSSPMVVISND